MEFFEFDRVMSQLFFDYILVGMPTNILVHHADQCAALSTLFPLFGGGRCGVSAVSYEPTRML